MNVSRSDKRRIYLGCFTTGARGEGSGITLAEQDADTGELAMVGEVAPAVSPAFLAWHPDGTKLYAANEAEGGAVTGYAVDPGTGGLRELGRQPTGGKGPCHLVVHPGGRYVLVANYGSGHLTAVPLDADGAPGPYTHLIHHEGSGPNQSRQREAHVHHVRVTPDGGYVLAVDLGIDAVVTYRLDEGTGKLERLGQAATAPGAGPRHLAFSPDGRYVYVAGELDSTVTTFELDTATGTLTALGAVPSTSTPAAAGDPDNYPSEIGISEDGRFLYVANRGRDLVGTLAVDGPQVRPIADVPTGGAWPRHLAVVGQHLYVANERSHEVTHFRLDSDSGVPEPAADVLSTKSPSCVLAAPLG